MSVEENKANQRRIYEEVIVKGNLELIPELVAPEYVFHNPLGIEAKGQEGFKQMVTMLRTAFPDIHCTIDDMVGEGDKTATRATLTMTFKGEMMGIPPTGRKATISGFLFAKWKDSKEVEAWESVDTVSFYQQLGIPIPNQ
jgi:predicted ester cyclase